LDDRLLMALAEDLKGGDLTGEAIFGTQQAKAVIRSKGRGILSAVGAALRMWHLLEQRTGASLGVECKALDGERVAPGAPVMVIAGPAAVLLAGERVALNLMQQMSGVATLTGRCIEASAGRTRIVDTRKTVPLWRDLQKQAVLHGGGSNHRLGLYDAYMIKDNHIDAAGGVREALRLVRQHNSQHREVTVEVRTLAELALALEEAGPDTYVMLDNMRGETLHEALLLCAGRVKTELSGGIAPEDLHAFCKLGIDRISMGCLTHSAPALDLSMKISL